MHSDRLDRGAEPPATSLAAMSTLRRLAWFGPLGAVLVAFLTGSVLYNLPLSFAPSVHPAAASVMGAYFGQDWRLFAPKPAQSVYAIVLDVRYDAADGTMHTAPPLEIERPLDQQTLVRSVAPTKLAGFPKALKLDLEAYGYALAQANRLPAPERGEASAALVRSYANSLSIFVRFLTMQARSYYPAEHVVAVRGTIARRPDAPYGRADGTAPTAPWYRVYQTAWLPAATDLTP